MPNRPRRADRIARERAGCWVAVDASSGKHPHNRIGIAGAPPIKAPCSPVQERHGWSRVLRGLTRQISPTPQRHDGTGQPARRLRLNVIETSLHRLISSMSWQPTTLTAAQKQERRLEGGRLLREGRLSHVESARHLGVSPVAVNKMLAQ